MSLKKKRVLLYNRVTVCETVRLRYDLLILFCIWELIRTFA